MPAGNGVGSTEQSWGQPDTAWEVEKAREGHRGKGLTQIGAASAGHQRLGLVTLWFVTVPSGARAAPTPSCPNFSPSLGSN